MIVKFLDVSVEGDKSEQDLKLLAVNAYISQKFDRLENDKIIKPDLETVRLAAGNLVNTYAGELRTKIGTDIPFQGDVYQLKQEEAKAFVKDVAADAAKYPVIFAEAAARQMTTAAVAAEYLYNANLWPKLLANIEAIRLGSLAKLQAAKSIADIEAVLSALG